MKKEIRVGDIMTRNFIHLPSDSNLLECARTMIKKRVGSIVIKDDDEIKGILTEKDIVWALTKRRGNDIDKILAKDIAARKIISIRPEASIQEAMEKMNKKKIRRMPVISNKKAIGYITLKDVVKFIPDIFEESRGFEKIKEEAEKIKRSRYAMNGNFLEAPCEGCGNFDILEKIDGRLLCESCRDVM